MSLAGSLSNKGDSSISFTAHQSTHTAARTSIRSSNMPPSLTSTTPSTMRHVNSIYTLPQPSTGCKQIGVAHLQGSTTDPHITAILLTEGSPLKQQFCRTHHRFTEFPVVRSTKKPGVTLKCKLKGSDTGQNKKQKLGVSTLTLATYLPKSPGVHTSDELAGDKRQELSSFSPRDKHARKRKAEQRGMDQRTGGETKKQRLGIFGFVRKFIKYNATNGGAGGGVEESVGQEN